jgi:hypothetical protein
MKILITFEHPSLVMHFKDVIRLLKHRGHDLYYYSTSKPQINEQFVSVFSPYLTFLPNLGIRDRYDMWMYDLTSWEGPTSPMNSLLEGYPGKLVCIANGDGAGFCPNRVSEKVLLKTALFMRNTLFEDVGRYYPPSLHKKLFLSTCYISNSQDFKNSSVPFLQKQRRAIFTGSLTGFAENGNPEGELCRIKVPMALIKAGVPCVYRLHNSNPQWKEKFEQDVPPEHKTIPLDRPHFIREMENSMIVLALRGNYHTVNRFFEGQASGGLVFTTKFRGEAQFYGHGDPGVHYVEISWDGSDVVEKANYYFNHLDEAETIARNGRKLWEECSMLDENGLLPPKVIDYYVEGIARVGGIQI